MKEVTDEMIRKTMAEPSVARVLKKALSRYGRQLSEDELYACGLHAVWGALAKHDESYGQKFTTSLWRYVDWTVGKELKRKKSRFVPLESIPEPKSRPQDDGLPGAEIEHLDETLRLLSRRQRELVDEYFRRGVTLEEIARKNNTSREAVRKRVETIRLRLRELLEDSDGDGND